MTINVQPVTEIIRVYDIGSYEEKSPFQGVATLLYENSDSVIIQGMHGNFTRRIFKEIARYLEDKGVIQFKMYRHGELKTINLKEFRV